MNISMLTMLSLLATAFILVFNILSFSTYSSVIYEEDIPEESCETILDCVLELYTSGAIGDDMETLAVGRFIFDTLYVVFMELLFESLVSGIMIDAFSELSQNDKAREEDMFGMCYICSMTKTNVRFYLNADLKNRGELWQAYQAASALELCLLYLCFGVKRQDRLLRNWVRHQERVRFWGGEMVPWFGRGEFWWADRGVGEGSEGQGDGVSWENNKFVREKQICSRRRNWKVVKVEASRMIKIEIPY